MRYSAIVGQWDELAAAILQQAVEDSRERPRPTNQYGMETLRQARMANRGWLQRWCDVLDARAFIIGESEPAWVDTLCSTVGIDPEAFLARTHKEDHANSDP
jgi:hypothetical protein